MKITLNGNIAPSIINAILDKQKEKMDKIDKFCKDNKINELSYRDSELEYEYISDSKKTSDNGKKVETRPKQVNKEVRGG